MTSWCVGRIGGAVGLTPGPIGTPERYWLADELKHCCVPYLRDRELQREINAALNVAESWNAGNAVLHYGKGGDIPGNRRDEQELTVLCLRVLQASVSFLNTLLIQDVLAGGGLQLTAEDQRAITPLFWSHIAPYGEVILDMSRRISLAGDTIPGNGGQAGT